MRKTLTTIVVALGILLGAAACSTTHSAQVFTTANGDQVEIWCTGTTLHSRPLVPSVYSTDAVGEIVNVNDPYCIQGAQGSYIAHDPWFLSWYGSYYYTPSYRALHPTIIYTPIPITYGTIQHVYVAPAGVKPGRIGTSGASTVTRPTTPKTLPPPKPNTRITSEPSVPRSPSGTLPPPAPGTRIPTGTPAPPKVSSAPRTTLPAPKPGTQITGPKAPSAPKPAAPRPASPRPAAPRPATRSGK